MAQIVGERVKKGDAIVDYDEKVFEDIQAEPGEKAYILMHTVPFEGSVGLVNMLTATRINRKGFDTHLVLPSRFLVLSCHRSGRGDLTV